MRSPCRRGFPGPKVPYVPILWVLVLLTALVSPSLADPASATGRPATPNRLTALQSELESGRKSLAEAHQLSQEERVRGREAVAKAGEFLTKAREWEVQAAGWETLRQTGAGQIAAIRKELEQPEALPPLEIASTTPLSVAEKTLTAKETERKKGRQGQFDFESEIAYQTGRRLDLPNLLEEARRRLEEAQRASEAIPKDNSLPVALQTLKTNAQIQRDTQEIRALELEGESYDLHLDLLKAQREQLGRQVRQVEAQEKAWRDFVNARRRQEADREATAARERLQAAANAIPQIRQLAEEISALADERSALAGRLASEAESISAKTFRLTNLRDDFQRVREKIKATGFTDAIGLLLRVKRNEFPPQETLSAAAGRRRQEIAGEQLQLIELDERIRALPGGETALTDWLSGLPASTTAEARQTIEATGRTLLRDRRKVLGALQSDHTILFSRLVDHDALDTQLGELQRTYSGFIDERVLWIRSCRPFGPGDLARTWRGLRWLFAPEHWVAVAAGLAGGFLAFPILWTIILGLMIALYGLRQRILPILDDLAAQSFRAATDHFAHAPHALLLTAAYSGYWPAALYLLSAILGSQEGTPPFVLAIVQALHPVAATWFACQVGINLFMDQGLAKGQFNWQFEEAFPWVRKQCSQALFLAGPLFFLYLVVTSQGSGATQESLGRLLFVLGLGCTAWSLHPVILPSGPLLTHLSRFYNARLIVRLRYILYFLTVALPLGLAVVACGGYFYTAERLFQKSLVSGAFLFFLILLYSLIFRALFVHRRHLALAQALERRSGTPFPRGTPPDGMPPSGTPPDGTPPGEPVQATSRGQPGPATVPGTRPSDSDGSAIKEVTTGTPTTELDITRLSHQTQHLLLNVTFIALLVGLWVIWEEVLPAIKILNQFQLWSTTVQSTSVTTGATGEPVRQMVDKVVVITLSNFLAAVIILIVTFSASRNLPAFLEISVLQRLPLDTGMRFAIRTLTRYFLSVLGILLAFGEIGIGWDQVQWLIAAVSVGLGFGLQEIFANFVSGIIILFERPMRVGDVVTIGEVSGTVSKIEIRATTITDWDRKELIVPNKEFITGRLVNWTLSDTIQRVVFKVGVAYGSNPDRVREILLEVARKSPFVLPDPPSSALLIAFGDSSLDFELRVFIPNLDSYTELIHTVNAAIDKALQEAGIEIPFPQQDLNIRSLPPEMGIPPQLPKKS